MASEWAYETEGRPPTAPVAGEMAERASDALEQRRFTLLVYHSGGAEMALLLPDKPLVVGREPPSDLCVPDPALSRAHARFVLSGSRIHVEDLGSTNGTWVGGARVRTADLAVGDEIRLGSLMVCVHALEPSETSFGIESEERFRSRLDEEVVRAHHFRGHFAVMMVRAAAGLSPPRPVSPRAMAGDPSIARVGRWAPAVRARIRSADRMAFYGFDALHILLPDVDAPTALAMARSLTALSRVRDDDPALMVGLAMYPDAATTPDMLIEASRSAFREASVDQPVGVAPTSSERAAADEAPLFVGAAMGDILDTVGRLANAKVPVILQGETGTGKEVLARLIHEKGGRRDAQIVSVNCGAIARELVETTFFGHERGSFTGAELTSKGVFEEADGGTLFLDEVGELPLPAQAALLRVLETGRLTRIGSQREIPVDVRLIAATHRDLSLMCDEGSFRRDLYFRLNAMTIVIPPLRDRRDEIEPLAIRMLRRANGANGSRVSTFEPGAMELLCAYAWPGNVRELRNAIERAVIVVQGDRIREQDLPARMRPAKQPMNGLRREPDPTEAPLSTERNRFDLPTAPPMQDDGSASFRERLQSREAQLINDALRATRGNQTEAAKRLGMPLRTLVHKIKAFCLKKPDER